VLLQVANSQGQPPTFRAWFQGLIK